MGEGAVVSGCVTSGEAGQLGGEGREEGSELPRKGRGRDRGGVGVGQRGIGGGGGGRGSFVGVGDLRWVQVGGAMSAVPAKLSAVSADSSSTTTLPR